MIVGHAQERELIQRVLTGLGADEDEATIQADVLVEADLRGHPSHGIQRLPVLAERIRQDLIRPSSHGRHEWASPAVLRVDGDRGFGPVVLFSAIEAVSKRAADTGLTAAFVANSNHIGMLAPYVEAIVANSQIGVVLTTAEAVVHPWDGREALLGANPIAIGIPADPDPLIVDMATSEVSMGQILEYGWRGQPLPDGWALGPDGEPTRDPEQASKGALTPFGGYKGFGLGLALGLLVSITTGCALGRDIKGTLDTVNVANKGDVVICIDPAGAHAPEARRLVSRYLDQIRRSAPATALRSISIPGDRGRAIRRERLLNGIPLAEAVWDRCQALLA